MKILQIAQTSLGIWAVGDDGLVYQWNTNINDWVPIVK